MLKKILSLMLVGVMVLSLTACGGKEVVLSGSDATDILDVEIQKAEINETIFKQKTYTITPIEVRHFEFYTYWKIKIKDEYKNRYTLKEVYAADLDYSSSAKSVFLLDEKEKTIRTSSAGDINNWTKADENNHRINLSIYNGKNKYNSLDYYLTTNEMPKNVDELIDFINDKIKNNKDEFTYDSNILNGIQIKVIEK